MVAEEQDTNPDSEVPVVEDPSFAGDLYQLAETLDDDPSFEDDQESENLSKDIALLQNKAYRMLLSFV